MEGHEQRLLEKNIRTNVRVLASRQAAAHANHLDTEGQSNWLAVESALGRRWTPRGRASLSITDQLRPYGLSLAGMVRTVLADGVARHRLMFTIDVVPGADQASRSAPKGPLGL